MARNQVAARRWVLSLLLLGLVVSFLLVMPCAAAKDEEGGDDAPATTDSETTDKKADEAPAAEEADGSKAADTEKKDEADADKKDDADAEKKVDADADKKDDADADKKGDADADKKDDADGDKKEDAGADEKASESDSKASEKPKADAADEESAGDKADAKKDEAKGEAEVSKKDEDEKEGSKKADEEKEESKKDDAEADDTKRPAEGETGAAKEKSASTDPKISDDERKAKDITADDKCADDAAEFCAKVKPGDQRLLDCLTDQVKLEKAGNAPKDSKKVSDGCKTEMRNFRIELYKDISMDKKMATACKDDIAMYCDDDFLYPEPGNVLACLRETKQVGKLSDGCKDKVFEAQLAAANDLKMDPQLNEICSSEADRLCKGVEPGGGRIQDCLRSKRNVLAWDCQAELFRQEVENADDIRLNVRLFNACLDDKKKFCPDVKPGDARVKDCLEMNKEKPEFSEGCRSEMVKMMERRARDFRLDPSLRKYCKQDISEICYPDAEDISDVANWDSKVIECLQDYRDELKDPRCRQQVHQLTKRASEDIRLDRPLAEACDADRTAYCKDVPEGNARVFMCLQDNRPRLKEACKTALFEQEVRYAEDIDFKFPLRAACTEEIKRFCDTIKAGQGDVIKCLQDHSEDADMGSTCKDEVKKDEQRSASDYRLNYKLNKECFHDVEQLCVHACDKLLEAGSQVCGGTVLKCLSDNKDKLKSKGCKDEVFYFQKREVKDIALDVPLQQACKDDISKLCPTVSKDHSKTLACLRNDRDALTPECKEEELRFSTMEASDIRLTPTLMNTCGLELQHFCRGVSPEEGHAFRCLQMNIEEMGMGIGCKAEVNLQTVRESEYYQFDTGLKLQCEQDVAKYCKGIDEGQEGHALVLKCLVDNYAKLNGQCQTEVTYLVRMSLWLYHKNEPLTQPCDEVVTTLCAGNVTVRLKDGGVLGSWGQCLTGHVEAINDKQCKDLVSLVAVEGGHVGAVLDDARLQETLNKLTQVSGGQLQLLTGARHKSGGYSGFVLTGWIAFAAVTALTAVLLGVGYFVYKKFYDPSRDYTLVVKAGDV